MAELEARQRALRDAILGDLPASMRDTRLAVYRRLVRGSLREAIESILPRTVAALGARLDAELDRFYSSRGPKTHDLRDVPLELVELLAPAWERDPTLPPHVADLARLEALELVVAIGDDRRREARAELSVDAPAIFQEAVAMASFRHAVHEADDPPAARAVELLVYRDPDHALRTLELTQAAAAILRRLLAGEPLGAAIQGGARDATVAVDDSLLTGTAKLLADLGDRGVLLGS